MIERIRSAVDQALAAIGAGQVLFAIEWPTETAHGDFAVNAAMAASKQLGKSPREIAEALMPMLAEALGEDAEKVEVAGPGFVNITLSRKYFAREMGDALKSKKWGWNESGASTSVMVEYSNPNPFKELHIGHLMSNVVGESLSRLLEASGRHVLRDTFGGDVGPHVAKALWAIQKKGITDLGNAKEVGEAYAHGAAAYENSEGTKREIDELNTHIYNVVAKGDAQELTDEEDRKLYELWKKGREVSMLEFERLFTLLGTSFDYAFFDSDTTKPGMRAVQNGLTRGIFEESEGAIIYRGEKKGLHTLVFITSRGTPTYETKDIGLSILKEERNPTDEVIIITAVEQVGHFRVFLAALEDIAPVLAAKTTHFPHGLLRLTSGKMSSRKGNIITASELLVDTIQLAQEKNADPLIAKQVAVGAIKYLILRSAPGADVVFDPEKSLSLEGDSGPYLQYAYVRARAVLDKAKEAGSTSATAEEMSAEPYLLERLIVRFPDIVARAERDRAPQHLAQYLTQLAGEWNSFYAQERIIGDEHEAYKLRVADAFARTMKEGLWLLGIPAPEGM